MKCHHGLNLSYATWTGRLPLLADFVRRGRMFERFAADGTPTGQPSPLRGDGWPDLADGQWHGVRVFGDMDGTMPEVSITDAEHGEFGSLPPGGHENARVIQRGRDALYLAWKGTHRRPKVADVEANNYGGFHGPSLAYLRGWAPACLRTLDLQLTNKITDWGRGRVRKNEPLQATDRGMAIELQVKLANLVGCPLWWPAPARYSLTVEEYESVLAEYLEIIRDNCDHPPMIQVGNELWNDKLGPGAWLRNLAAAQGRRVSSVAADEVATLRRVGDRVFGPAGPLGQRRWYLFVDGCLADPSYLDRVLGSLPPGTADAAGPAFYVGPSRDDVVGWERTDYVPDQLELAASCNRRLVDAAELLRRNVAIARTHGVEYPAVYEAGQAMLVGDEPWRAAALQAQGEEWMGDLYRGMRAALEANGVAMSCWYSLMSNQRPADLRTLFGLSAGLGTSELPKEKGARGL